MLAYSTISQLGYMFLACGVAAYSAAIFHLVTHAFFKALLFLAAGSVIHAMGGEQDMRKMGGLRNKLPVTFWTMTAAVFAIAGFPPSPASSPKTPSSTLHFFRDRRQDPLVRRPGHGAAHFALHVPPLVHDLPRRAAQRSTPITHESPWSMLVPLVILACFPSAAAGSASSASAHTSLPSVGRIAPCPPAIRVLELILSIAAVLVALEGWLIADKYYRRKPERPAQLAAALPAGYKLLANKYYVDEIYGAVIVKPLLAFSKYVLGWVVDTAMLGGVAWLLAGIASFSGMILQRWQSGNLRSYAAWLAAGAAAVLLFLLLACHVEPSSCIRPSSS